MIRHGLCLLSLVSRRPSHRFTKGSFTLPSTAVIHWTPGLCFYGSLDPLCLDMDSAVQTRGEFWVCFVGSGETPSLHPPLRPPQSLSGPPPLVDPPSHHPNVSLITRKEQIGKMTTCCVPVWDSDGQLDTCVVLCSVSLVILDVDVDSLGFE